ncbi:PQQ-binding-like beta-propeller repeat protein, partial [candidate division WOR-3 bacterium]|nr:PQQ-binding-like beta-propeller repeat protein [candidate division WOR-3 bacterium]
SGLSDESVGDSVGLRWERTLSGMFGLPVFIGQDRLVTSRFQSINYTPVVCHDLATGDTLWTRDFGGTNSRSIPLGINDGRVYAMNFQELTYQKDTLYALDADDGSILWTAGIRVQMSISESVTFASDGDPLVTADSFRIARINREDGTVQWTARRVWPVTGSCDIVAYGDRCYCYGGDIGSLYLAAFDEATGTLIDTCRIEDTHPGGPMPQAAPMVGPGGTIYCHKVGDNVTAVRDDGDSLVKLWTAEISGTTPYYSPFAHFAVGPDSTVYAASWGRIIRLDPATGAKLDSSPVIQDTTQVIFHVRISVGANGVVLVSSGGYPPLGGLYAFTPDLEPLWYEPIQRLNTCGPAIGPGGVVAVAGDGRVLKVFDPFTGLAANPAPRPEPALLARPNPFRTAVSLQLTAGGPDRADIFDASGRLVRRLAVGRQPSAVGSLTWDGRDDAGKELGPGVYVCRCGTSSVRLVKAE